MFEIADNLLLFSGSAVVGCQLLVDEYYFSEILYLKAF